MSKHTPYGGFKMDDLQRCTELESIIDRDGLAEVLDRLVTICTLKADHIRTNWQDRYTAQPWDILATSLERSHVKAVDLDI